MKKFSWWKWLLIGAFFLMLHFSYGTFPNNFVLIFGESSEAIFTHMKMAFWAYLFASAVEYFLRRRQIKAVEHFIYTRLFVAVVYPWPTITLWFTATALGFHLPEIPWELIYANITSAMGAFIGLQLESLLDDVKYPAIFKAAIVLLFVLALLSYISFTFNPPDPGYFFIGP